MNAPARTQDKSKGKNVARLRILVLTSSTGGGHDARAQAFAEWCYLLYRHEVDVRIEQMLEKSSLLNRNGVSLYNWIQKRAPFLHTVFYTVVEALSFINRDSVQIGRAYYLQVLREYQPHLLLSVHDCLNRGYFQLARKTLGADRVRCATYCGEFSGGWGYSRNWVEPSVDLYVSRTATARDYAVKCGLPAEKAIVRGHLMRPRSYTEVVSRERKATFLEELSLDPGLFTFFLATGGNGANNHLELLGELRRHHPRCQAIVICGKNQDTYNSLLQWRAQNPEFECYIEGYSEQVHLFMQVSDAIVTRGGTTTCAKALHFRCPIIFNAFGGIMPQEQLTWKFFRNGKAAEKVENAAEFGRLVDSWIAFPQHYQSLRENFLRLRYEEDPKGLIREMVDLARTVSTVAARRVPRPRLRQS